MTAPAPRPDPVHQERFPWPYSHGAIAASESIKLGALWDRVLRLDHVWYNNPTGFAADAANYWTIELTDGTNVLASWSTQTGAEGTLTADTPVAIPLSATHTDLDEGLVLTLVFTKTGVPANLPAGQLLADGHAL